MGTVEGKKSQVVEKLRTTKLRKVRKLRTPKVSVLEPNSNLYLASQKKQAEDDNSLSNMIDDEFKDDIPARIHVSPCPAQKPCDQMKGVEPVNPMQPILPDVVQPEQLSQLVEQLKTM